MREFPTEWRITINLLRIAIRNEPSEAERIPALSEELLQRIYTLSNQFDVAHIVDAVLSEIIPDHPAGGVFDGFRRSRYMAEMRYERISYELSRMEGIFEDENIRYIPLKGAEMRKYYAQPWMRTSCDIDILVPKEDAERAWKALTDRLSYKLIGRSPYDIPLQSKSGIAVELHHSLAERNPVMKSNDILHTVWDTAVSDGTNRYSMTDEMFYFYHIAHMAKHFEQGGCGIRPFMDVWILNHRTDYDPKKRQSLLERGGLLNFAGHCENLSEVWFGEAAPTELTDLFEAYILSGGMYGTISNSVKVQKNQRGGKLAYIRSRLFMPYDRLKNVYPILQKHKCLLPVMEVRRWVKMVTDGRMNRSVAELKSLRADDSETMFVDFLENVGLK